MPRGKSTVINTDTDALSVSSSSSSLSSAAASNSKFKAQSKSKAQTKSTKTTRRTKQSSKAATTAATTATTATTAVQVEKLDGLMSSMIKIFDDAQRSFATHHRCALQLRQLQAQHQRDNNKGNNMNNLFQSHLLVLLNHVLLVFKREPSVERLIEFICNFVTQPLDATPASSSSKKGGQSDDGIDQELDTQLRDSLAIFLLE